MNPNESNLTLIHGGRDEIERELVRLVLTTFPIPEEEYNRLLSMLEPRFGQVSIASTKKDLTDSSMPDAETNNID
ncbi:hypothetical protein ANAEL_00426 [Anaerolineales bacterium]|nr:hypothetical protein ANAEL_00426 [Anaerolineales bacterium]